MGALQDEIGRRYQLFPANHMTHLSNFAAIVAAGGLSSYNRMRGGSYFNLANEDVQAGRALITVPETGRPLHDYVPLYFAFKTPMVAVNQAHNESLLFLRFPLDLLAMGGVVITDGNARSRETRFQIYEQIDDLGFIDAKAVNTVKYAGIGKESIKRRKQAEILVPDFLPLGWMQDLICFNSSTQAQVLDISSKSGIKMSVIVNPGWYFTSRA
jgi:hypothetical protein